MEEARQRRLADLELYERRLARNRIVLQQKEKRQQERYKAALKSLESERSVWIANAEDVENMVTEDLFSAPCT